LPPPLNVDNGKASISQGHAVFRIQTEVIGATVAKSAAHRLQYAVGWKRRAAESYDTGYATH
jgi:hypothetical protein